VAVSSSVLRSSVHRRTPSEYEADSELDADAQLWLNTQMTQWHQTLRCDRVTLILIDLHWLRSLQHIHFKRAELIYRYLHCMAPQYLSSYIQHVFDFSHHCLKLQWIVCRTHFVTVGDHAFLFGTVCQMMSPLNRRLPSFGNVWKPTCSTSLTILTIDFLLSVSHHAQWPSTVYTWSL